MSAHLANELRICLCALMRLTPRPAAAGRSRRRRFRFQLPNMVPTATFPLPCPLPPSGGSCDVRARERRGTERQRRKYNCYVTCSRVRSESRGSSGCSCISWYAPREVGWRVVGDCVVINHCEEAKVCITTT
ncbi:hypothetical protein Ctob_008237 [Chrysochromulina tobinii]|uniref:Uncharacterized protein n=1 Tax=Chrysochromulina tobinii TaxID=1460289 RepID=A0A0M0JW61_9EUKA|nr:hypothetical protein Ctob_008237 [Chrysochromulina tobinii]|eukprot:KOO30522.1 hypothetical protein Ctob_008237 [Chrysochromulina sp. CCMP291]